MMSTSALSLLILVASATPYERARSGAETIENLGRFLEEYVGQCDSDEPIFDKAACERKAQDARKRYRGRTLLLEIDSPRDQVSVATFDERKKMFRIHLTPFFSERGLGLSVGRPRKLTAEGYPVVRNVPIWVKLPDGEPEFVFRRQLDRGMVRLELIFKPKRAWQLKSRGGDAVRGAEVALVGVRVYGSRGSSVLAEQTY